MQFTVYLVNKGARLTQSPQLPPSLGPDPPYYARPRPEQVDICYRAACNGDLDTLGEQA
jgi:hypothetical protein